MGGGTVMAIDGNSLVHRSYHALAGTGQPNWAVRGLLTQLVAAVERIRPVAVVAGFDDPDSSVRRETWPAYKAHRGEKLDTLVEQLAAATSALRRLGVAVVVPTGLEADDVLASTARHARERGLRAVAVTSDRDAFALIDDNTHVLRIINGGVDASPLMTGERLLLLLGVRPGQYRDFAALRGDASDNLPGVRGIGPRTAARLLAEFGAARAAFDDLEAVRAKLGRGVASRLGADGARARWELNCAVMAMRDDLAIGAALGDGAGAVPLDAGRVGDCYREHGLTWSTRDALRVLAETDAPYDGAVQPAEPVVETIGWGQRPAARSLPRLRPKPAQLTLF